jgi:hypothetical protein
VIAASAPRLSAQFKTNDKGEPAFVEADGRKHYRIVFEVLNPPSDAYAATFELDPTYYDPVRTLSADADGAFRLETTSYGDYDVKVRVRTKSGDVPLAGSLARALEQSRERMTPSPAVDSAIAYISKH